MVEWLLKVRYYDALDLVGFGRLYSTRRSE